MLDEKFKMEVVQRLARIEENLPICIRDKMEEKVAMNRRMIFLSLTLYTTSFIGIIYTLIT